MSLVLDEHEAALEAEYLALLGGGFFDPEVHDSFDLDETPSERP